MATSVSAVAFPKGACSRCEQTFSPLPSRYGTTAHVRQSEQRLNARRRVVTCAVSGEAKKKVGGSDASKKQNLVVRVEDPLAGRPYRPPMPGDQPDFWEGSRWDLVGFVAEYLWAFGIVLAIVASIYAVSNYSTEDEITAPAPGTEAITVEEQPSGATVEAFDLEDDAPPL